MQTPLTQWNTMTPSTRETIDLTFDDENDTKFQKKEPSTSSAHIPDPPQTVTFRKRPKNGDVQNKTPSRPPPKKQKSPTGEALPIAIRDSYKLSGLRSPSPRQSAFTQVPDSEGEIDDEFCYGEDFYSDDIPMDTKEVLQRAPAETLASEMNDRDDVIVPESPFKLGKANHETDWSVNNQNHCLPSDSLNNVTVPHDTNAKTLRVLFLLYI